MNKIYLQNQKELKAFLAQFYFTNPPPYEIHLRTGMEGCDVNVENITEEDFIRHISNELIEPVSFVTIKNKTHESFIKNYNVVEEQPPFGFKVPCGMYAVNVKEI